jgi:hypothetical protein
MSKQQNYQTFGILDEHMLAPDLMLPSQFNIGSTQLEPEQRLVLAILQDALNCWRKENVRGVYAIRLQVEAHEWLFAVSDAGDFSFVNVCDVLGIHPGYFREKLTAWAAAGGKMTRASRRAEVGRVETRINPSLRRQRAYKGRPSVRTEVFCDLT